MSCCETGKNGPTTLSGTNFPSEGSAGTSSDENLSTSFISGSKRRWILPCDLGCRGKAGRDASVKRFAWLHAEFLGHSALADDGKAGQSFIINDAGLDALAFHLPERLSEASNTVSGFDGGRKGELQRFELQNV